MEEGSDSVASNGRLPRTSELDAVEPAPGMVCPVMVVGFSKDVEVVVGVALGRGDGFGED